MVPNPTPTPTPTPTLPLGCYDLLFFGIVFGLSLFSFCMLFYIQLGSFMDDYYSQVRV